MPSGPPRTATGISVAIARDPALVRTVRLVAAAVARRTSGDEEFVEEVRLAVGEACALLVGAHADVANHGVGSLDGPVEVSMHVHDRFRVTVSAPGDVPVEELPASDVDGIEPWGLLSGLIADLEVDRGEAGTSLSMSWALRGR